MILAVAGVLLALVVAYVLNRPVKPQPPAFQPSASPYAKAIFANGIIESDQASGENLNIFPEVTGPMVATYIHEGQAVRAGQPLFAIDDSVQRATAEQARLQAQAAQALLAELKAEPRRETLDIAVSQLDQARANQKTLDDQRDKLQRSAALDPRSVSQESLDSAIDAAKAQATAEGHVICPASTARAASCHVKPPGTIFTLDDGGRGHVQQLVVLADVQERGGLGGEVPPAAWHGCARGDVSGWRWSTRERVRTVRVGGRGRPARLDARHIHARAARGGHGAAQCVGGGLQVGLVALGRRGAAIQTACACGVGPRGRSGGKTTTQQLRGPRGGRHHATVCVSAAVGTPPRGQPQLNCEGSTSPSPGRPSPASPRGRSRARARRRRRRGCRARGAARRAPRRAARPQGTRRSAR